MMGVDDMLREHGAWCMVLQNRFNGKWYFPKCPPQATDFFFLFFFFSSTLFMYLFLVQIIL
jgi:hypothetical protein